MAFDFSNPSALLDNAWKGMTGQQGPAQDTTAAQRFNAFKQAIQGSGATAPADPMAAVRQRMGLENGIMSLANPAVDPSRRGLDLGSGQRNVQPASTLNGDPSWKRGVMDQARWSASPDGQLTQGRVTNTIGLEALDGKEQIVSRARDEDTRRTGQLTTLVSDLTKGERSQAAGLVNTDRDNQTRNQLQLIDANTGSLTSQTKALGEATAGIVSVDNQGRLALTNASGDADVRKILAHQDPNDERRLTAEGYKNYMTSLGEANKTMAGAYAQSQSPFGSLMRNLPQLATAAALAFGGRG